MRNTSIGWTCCVVTALGVFGCGFGTSSDKSTALAPGDANFGTGGSSAGPVTGAGGAATVPPEQELEASFRVPVVTGSRLWSANPTSGRVALIDSTSYDVKTVEAGFAPTYLAAIGAEAGSNSAIVLNVLSHDATWMHVDATGAVT